MTNENDTVNVLARRIEGLPKWAQDHIKSLQREVERAQCEAKEARLEIEDPSDVTFVRSSSVREVVPLQRGARVIFRTPGGEIRVYWDDLIEAVVAYAYAEVDEEFVVQPRVSNSISMRLGRIS